jgi:hypothetical protein
VRFVVSANLLVYPANRDSAEHRPARSALEEWLGGSTPWAVTWGIVYEFLRIVTHPKVFRQPLGADEALSFLNPIRTSEVVSVLVPTERHGTLLRETIGAFGAPAGNIFHDCNYSPVSA